MQRSFKIYLYGLLGNVFDHYELALYGLLTPIFTKLFFLEDSQVTAYIKSYAIFFIFLFSRLLGAWYFGKIGDKKGYSYALSYTLLGMAAVAILIGFMPTVETAGKFAPCLLFSLLMIQNFFASGEKIGGVLYILENSNSEQKPIVGSIYDASSILGYILATSCVAMLGDSVNVYWRYLYIFSAVCAFFGFLVRKNIFTSYPRQSCSEKPQLNYSSQLSIVFVVCFSYALYYITMTLMNSWIPLITNISYAKVLHMNIYLLILDALSLPLAGYLSYKYGLQKIMRFSIFLNLVCVAPLFYLFKSNSFSIVLIARIFLTLSAVLFSAPCYYYAYQKTNAKNRFQTIAIANVVGAHLGKSAPMIAYWIYQKTQLIISPALPILAFGVLALYFLRETNKQIASDMQLS